MPLAPGPVSGLSSRRQQLRRLRDLQDAVSASMAEPYRAHQQPDGVVLLVPVRAERGMDADAEAILRTKVHRAIWRCRSMALSRTESAYLLPDLDASITVRDFRKGLRELATPASRLVSIPGAVPIDGAIVDLADRIRHLFECRDPPPPPVMQPQANEHHWVTIGVDGTSRHNTSYVHCVLGLDVHCGRQASWWLFRGAEKWSTVYTVAQTEGFDSQLRQAAEVVHTDRHGQRRKPLFFVLADGKAQVLLSGCTDFKSHVGCVCWVCGLSRSEVIELFGKESTLLGAIIEMVLPSAQMRGVPPNRRIPDFGLHGVCRVTLCGVTGMMQAVWDLTGAAKAPLARKVQAVLDVARLLSKCVSRASSNAKEANKKGAVRFEATATVHFMQSGLWGALVAVLEAEPGMRGHTIDVDGGMLWGDACRAWWSSFAATCSLVWQTRFLDGAQLQELWESCTTMARLHKALGFSIVLWSHLWIDHLYAFARKWRTVARFACFVVEGSHRRLKRMLRNSGGVGLLRGKSGLQVVIDNHTVDDSLLHLGWDVAQRAGKAQAASRTLFWKTRATQRRNQMSTGSIALARVLERRRVRAMARRNK